MLVLFGAFAAPPRCSALRHCSCVCSAIEPYRRAFLLPTARRPTAPPVRSLRLTADTRATHRGQLEALFGALVLTVTAYGQSESHCGRCSGRAEGSDQPERPVWRNGLADGRCRRRTGTYTHAVTFSRSCMRQQARLQASKICQCCLATAHSCHTIEHTAGMQLPLCRLGFHIGRVCLRMGLGVTEYTC